MAVIWIKVRQWKIICAALVTGVLAAHVLYGTPLSWLSSDLWNPSPISPGRPRNMHVKHSDTDYHKEIRREDRRRDHLLDRNGAAGLGEVNGNIDGDTNGVVAGDDDVVVGAGPYARVRANDENWAFDTFGGFGEGFDTISVVDDGGVSLLEDSDSMNGAGRGKAVSREDFDADGDVTDSHVTFVNREEKGQTMKHEAISTRRGDVSHEMAAERNRGVSTKQALPTNLNLEPNDEVSDIDVPADRAFRSDNVLTEKVNNGRLEQLKFEADLEEKEMEQIGLLLAEMHAASGSGIFKKRIFNPGEEKDYEDDRVSMVNAGKDNELNKVDSSKTGSETKTRQMEESRRRSRHSKVRNVKSPILENKSTPQKQLSNSKKDRSRKFDNKVIYRTKRLLKNKSLANHVAGRSRAFVGRKRTFAAKITKDKPSLVSDFKKQSEIADIQRNSNQNIQKPKPRFTHDYKEAKETSISKRMLVKTAEIEDIRALTMDSNNGSVASIEDKSNSNPQVIKLILLTYMRSGSSYLGSLLEISPSIFYIFEPLYATQKNYGYPDRFRFLPTYNKSDLNTSKSGNPKTSDSGDYFRSNFTVIRTLRNFLDCRFCDLDLETLGQVTMGQSMATLELSDCVNYRNLPLELAAVRQCCKQTSDACRTASTVGVKVIRLTVRQAREMMKADGNVKLLHLFRDPRGMFQSQIWSRFRPESFVNETISFCDRIIRDLRDHRALAIEFPQRTLLVRYEDVVKSPIQALSKIYTFAGLQLTALGREEAVHVSADKRRPYRWRKKIRPDRARTVESNCAPLFKSLGYRIFPNNATIKDDVFLTLKKDFAINWPGEVLRIL